ncbi:MAG: hypothetical protein JRI59_01750 [Deltaproteobacteria bacterium]|nr:hypothetical protein [Deltaproteobacteria bacterium]
MARLISGDNRERGAVLPITAIFILAAIGMLALGIDLGRLFLVKCELQRIADASALAGALRLVVPPGTNGLVSTTPDCNRALTAAQAVATSNTADADPLPLDNLDLQLGIYNPDTGEFTDTGCADPWTVNAVQATATKTITFFLGGIFSGSSQTTLSARAVALTGPVGSLPPGTYTLPLAIDADKVPSQGEKVVIELNPSPTDDGCWHTFFEQSSSSSLLRDMIEGDYPTPRVKVGDFINVKEGVSDSVLRTLGRALDDHGGTWEVVVPVVPAGSHAGWAEVLGFAAIRLTLVDSHGGDKRIEAETLENYVAPGASPGGTTDYGLFAGAPKLVQ